MHLKAIALRGFKSFPNRTKLEFGPGVSVIVGPNGSGKSNITDAVLWALGEQSPLAVRGQAMKDVIFAGGHGVKGSSAAEVEVVIDNQAGRLGSDFSEISIVRRLARDGEGEYRLNGARCRLVDVLEVLSDSGLGKEMHSVVSQGKVEAIVLSRPRERRLLIEEAAGLAKHRKRRRRAQLKLERTGENLSRALDVEREARSHLRPLKRQAEAAQLHERLERQSLEARLELARDDVRRARADLAEAESRSAAARSERDEAERLLTAVAERREAAEEAFAAQSRLREELQGRLFGARSAAERIGIRLERARDQAHAAGERRERRAAQLALLEEQLRSSERPADPDGRIAELEQELAGLEEARERRLGDRLAELEEQRREAERRRDELAETAAGLRAELEAAEHATEAARVRRREVERASEDARAKAAKAASELGQVERLLRASMPAPEGVEALADGIEVEEGYEGALATVLGPRLAAGIVEGVPAGERLLDAAGDSGGTALVRSRARGRAAGRAPSPGAQRLLAHVNPSRQFARLAERLLANVWIVDSLEAVSEYFDGVAVTRSGRVLDASRGELSQAPPGGAERLLAERGRRDELAAQSERAAAEAAGAHGEVEEASQAEKDRREREGAVRALRAGIQRDEALQAAAGRAAAALQAAGEAVAGRREALEAELEAGAAKGDETGEELRACAHEEAGLQGRLREASEAVTGAEVAAQQVRDSAAESERELAEIAGRLGLEPEPAEDKLPEDEREALAARVERLARRREQLGPVNPLAAREYEEAVAHVEELEVQRKDLESALAELEGLIRETDRQIRESFEQTFEAAARNFEDVVEHLFPGGRGRLRLVQAEMGPRPGVGGAGAEAGTGDEEQPEGQSDEEPEAGVEVEVTPAGKATKRLSLLSGGEKSLVALAFMFAVFLARPCPFYILDEVEAALDDINIDRFLELVRRYSDRAQFIVVTHQKRTMDAADTLYGVSMGADGVSQVISRKLSGRPAAADEAAA